MRTALRLVIAAAIVAPALALAQASASVQLRLDLPVVLPHLVVVSPGVQVVPDVQEEVFFTDGWYWVRYDGGWYRSHSPRGAWFVVAPGRVPRRLVALPPGHYRHWHPPPPRRAAPVGYRPAPPPRFEPYPYGERHEERGKHGGHGHGGEGNGHGNGNGRGHGDRD